ncbi:MAG: Nif3-like dinuclear metal center hexameric protein [Gammaproteobacteria bacterium]|nr:MAG: Nif3-like dinuclear metal center hexameric protein [Gammaproteobacteria bacterium]
MSTIDQIANYTNDLLEIEKFKDYAPNGVQVTCQQNIKRIVAGVTASQNLIDAAADAQADLLLVHHGFFWKNEAPTLTGIKYRRIRSLIHHDMALMAYHLPLDAHPELGNNAQLARRLNIRPAGTFCRHEAVDIGLYGETDTAVSIGDLGRFVSRQLGRQALIICAGDHEIKRIGLCTGGAQHYIIEAAERGLDAFISGEISEQTTHLARELGIHYIAAGHHATERYGVQALGEHLAKTFSLEYLFIEDSNPA